MAAAAKQEKKKETDWQLRNHPKANEKGEYGSPQGNGKEEQSRNRGAAGAGGHGQKPRDGQGQYDSEQGTSDSQQHGQGHYSGPEKRGTAGPSRNHQSGRGRELRGSPEIVVSTDQPDARFDSADPEQTDIKSRPRVDSIGAWSGHM
jgi:hypothetical protein